MSDEGIEIRIAGPEDRARILHLREVVYVVEQHRVERVEDLAAFDKYDEFATYFIAYAEGVAVGTARVITDSALGLPCEKGVDLSAIRINNRLVEVGHCITLPALRWRGLGFRLMREAFEYGVTRLHATQVLVDFFIDETSPGSMRFHRALGFKPLGQPYRDPRFNYSPESVVAILAVEEALKRRQRISPARDAGSVR